MGEQFLIGLLCTVAVIALVFNGLYLHARKTNKQLESAGQERIDSAEKLALPGAQNRAIDPKTVAAIAAAVAVMSQRTPNVKFRIRNITKL